LAKSLPPLTSISEENHHETVADETHDRVVLPATPLQTLTTYKQAFPQYQKGGLEPSSKDIFNEQDHSVDTVQLDDEQSSFPSDLHAKTTPARRAKAHGDSLTTQQMEAFRTNVVDDSEEHQLAAHKEPSSPRKPHVILQEHNEKSLKIRDLQKKLSHQEEASKKLFDELQTKQTRLENAIRLLLKQGPFHTQRHSPEPNASKGESLAFDRIRLNCSFR
jgi:hypothetical protein